MEVIIPAKDYVKEAVSAQLAWCGSYCSCDEKGPKTLIKGH